MKKILLLASFLIGVVGAHCQDYNAAIGLRGGLYNGVSFRKMLSSGDAFEAILSARYGGFKATALYEIQKDFPSPQRMHWYFGGGAHVGIYETSKYDHQLPGHEINTIIGIDGIIGMEYNFDFPLNLSIDWKPAFNLVGYGSFIGDGFAASARYYF